MADQQEDQSLNNNFTNTNNNPNTSNNHNIHNTHNLNNDHQVGNHQDSWEERWIGSNQQCT